MTTAWLIGGFSICQNTLQAVGAATPALLTSVFRQGVIFIPALFIMKSFLGVDGLILAQPVPDVLSLIIVAIMLRMKIRKTDFTSVKGSDEETSAGSLDE